MMGPYVPLACVLGFLGVGLGAFGAHALETMVPPARLETWSTAVNYHLMHTLAILLFSALFPADTNLWATRAQRFFSLGIMVFSGSLYALVLTDTGAFGAVTPLGGLSFLIGWWCAFMASRQGVGD